MTVRALPLIVVSLILYNVFILLAGATPITTILANPVIRLPLMTANLPLTWSDVLIFITMILLFIELMKSTYSSTAALLDHGLSMLVFVACLIEFLMVPQAASSTFFFITVACAIDVVAGYTIGIRVARRDLSIGTDA